MYVAGSGSPVSHLGPFGALVLFSFSIDAWQSFGERKSYKMYDSLIPEIKRENDTG